MNPVPVNEPLLDGNEKKYLFECIETGWISSEGSFIKQFEEQFAKRVGCKYSYLFQELTMPKIFIRCIAWY